MEFVSTSKSKYDPPLKSKPRLIVCFGRSGMLAFQKFGSARKKPIKQTINSDIFLVVEK